MRTSVALRLFMPKSAPAAPAVAKNPMTICEQQREGEEGIAGRLARNSLMPGAALKKTIRIMRKGIALSSSETLATYWMPFTPTKAIT